MKQICDIEYLKYNTFFDVFFYLSSLTNINENINLRLKCCINKQKKQTWYTPVNAYQ